jgi:hypothetical protein
MNGRPNGERPWIGRIATVLVAIVAFLWFIQMRTAPGQLLERRACERAYSEARTAAETLAVDARDPLQQSRETSALTCGSLRRAGRL